ncbi:MAG: prepilin-type N-terminal cleavage/methylation domain-containing protein [Verrucomicrobiota bacterium]
MFDSNKFNPQRKKSAGFTLTEMMISVALVSLLSVGLLTFMLDVARGIFWGTEKTEISEDVREFTMRLAAEARSANSAIIYASFDPDDRNSGGDRRDDQQSGDCLVLINTEYYPDTSGTEHYTDIIVYFRTEDEEGDGAGPVHRFEWSASSVANYYDSADYELEEVLALVAPDEDTSNPVVIELSRGVADGRLFTNYQQGMVTVINGEILHGNKVKEVTNTYNLSISPRG